MATQIDTKKILEWVKQNQALTISAAVSLILIIAATCYLLSCVSASTLKMEELAQARSELEGFQNRSPFPNEENIKLLTAENEKLEALCEQYKSRFGVIPMDAEAATPQGFRYNLENMINNLTDKAKKYAVQMPTNRINFSFSFTAQREKLSKDTNNLKIQAEQLSHVNYLCDMVMGSGITEFERVRRAIGTPGDLLEAMNYMADYLPARKIITNNFSVSYPYEIVFKTGSADLGKLLNQMEESPYAIMIKSLKVEPITAVVNDELAGYSESFEVAGARSRYSRMRGMGNLRGGMMQQPLIQEEEKPKDPLHPKVTTTILKPSALRVSMLVDVSRLRTTEEGGGKAGSATATLVHPEGTDIQTFTAEDGTVTENAAYKDGTYIVSTKSPDGTIIRETTTPDGVYKKQKITPDGQVTDME